MKELILCLKFFRKNWQLRLLGHFLLLKVPVSKLERKEWRRAGAHDILDLFKVGFNNFFRDRLEDIHEIKDGPVRQSLIHVPAIKTRAGIRNKFVALMLSKIFG
mgnify:FL=1